MNFDIVTRAGLTQKEFAELIGVSRITAHKYLNGRSRPTSQGAIRRAEKALALLSRLVDSAKLPMQTTEREKRKNNIEKLKQYLGA